MTNLGFFQQIPPCIAPGTHNFVPTWPPRGITVGSPVIVCSRCGMKSPNK